MTNHLSICDVPMHAAPLDIDGLDILQAITPNSGSLRNNIFFKQLGKQLVLKVGQDLFLEDSDGIYCVKVTRIC